MERTEVLDMMSGLKLYGMRSACDETLATALKRKHEPQRLVGDLLKAEISEKQARSIKNQLTVPKLPLAKDVEDFAFKDTPINEALVRDLAGGEFIAQQRNVVLVGGTGTGKTHLAIAIARSCIRAGSRGRFFTTVDLVNQLEAEGRAGRQGRIADYLTRLESASVSLSACPPRWQVHRLRCPDDAGSRLLLFPRRSRTPTAFLQRSRFSNGSQNLNPNHSHSARLVQNAAFGFPFDSYRAFSHQVGRSPSRRCPVASITRAGIW